MRQTLTIHQEFYMDVLEYQEAIKRVYQWLKMANGIPRDPEAVAAEVLSIVYQTDASADIADHQAELEAEEMEDGRHTLVDVADDDPMVTDVGTPGDQADGHYLNYHDD